MLNLSKKLRSLALAGAGGIAIAAASASVASAQYTYTRCNADGDRCWQVRCDDHGDYCRNIGFISGGYYTPRYHYRGPHRHWVCDRYGDRCHWGYYSEPHVSFGFGW